jgi:hypothetical protein
MFFAESESGGFFNIIFYIIVFGFIFGGNLLKAYRDSQKKKTNVPSDPRHDPIPSIEAEKTMKELMEALGMKPEEITPRPVMPVPQAKRVFIEEEGQSSLSEGVIQRPVLHKVTDEELRLALQMESIEQKREAKSSKKFSFNKSRLRDAVILKEILDPPIALR